MESGPSPVLWNEFEARIVRLVSQGFNDRQIADELFLSEATVERFVNSILRGLGLCDRLDLILYGILHGLGSGHPARGLEALPRDHRVAAGAHSG